MFLQLTSAKEYMKCENLFSLKKRINIINKENNVYPSPHHPVDNCNYTAPKVKDGFHIATRPLTVYK